MWLCGLDRLVRRRPSSERRKESEGCPPDADGTTHVSPPQTTALDIPRNPRNLVHDAAALLVVLEQLPLPVSLVLEDTGSVILQNRHSLEVWGGLPHGESLLLALFRNADEDLFTEALQELSNSGAWRGLLRVPVLAAASYEALESVDKRPAAVLEPSADAHFPQLPPSEPGFQNTPCEPQDAAYVSDKLRQPYQEAVATAAAASYSNRQLHRLGTSLDCSRRESLTVGTQPGSDPVLAPSTVVLLGSNDRPGPGSPWQRPLSSRILPVPRSNSLLQQQSNMRSSSGNWSMEPGRRLFAPETQATSTAQASMTTSNPQTCISTAGACDPASSSWLSLSTVPHNTVSTVGGVRTGAATDTAAQEKPLPVTRPPPIPSTAAGATAPLVFPFARASVSGCAPYDDGASVHCPDREVAGSATALLKLESRGLRREASLGSNLAHSSSLPQSQQQAALINALTTSAWGTMMKGPRNRRPPHRISSVQMLGPARSGCDSPQSGCTPYGTPVGSALHEHKPRSAWQAEAAVAAATVSAVGTPSGAGPRGPLCVGSLRSPLSEMDIAGGSQALRSPHELDSEQGTHGVRRFPSMSAASSAAAAAMLRGSARPLVPIAAMRRHSYFNVPATSAPLQRVEVPESTTPGGGADGAGSGGGGSRASESADPSVSLYVSGLFQKQSAPAYDHGQGGNEDTSLHSGRTGLPSTPSIGAGAGAMARILSITLATVANKPGPRRSRAATATATSPLAEGASAEAAPGCSSLSDTPASGANPRQSFNSLPVSDGQLMAVPAERSGLSNLGTRIQGDAAGGKHHYERVEGLMIRADMDDEEDTPRGESDGDGRGSPSCNGPCGQNTAASQLNALVGTATALSSFATDPRINAVKAFNSTRGDTSSSKNQDAGMLESQLLVSLDLQPRGRGQMDSTASETAVLYRGEAFHLTAHSIGALQASPAESARADAASEACGRAAERRLTIPAANSGFSGGCHIQDEDGPSVNTALSAGFGSQIGAQGAVTSGSPRSVPTTSSLPPSLTAAGDVDSSVGAYAAGCVTSPNVASASSQRAVAAAYDACSASSGVGRAAPSRLGGGGGREGAAAPWVPVVMPPRAPQAASPTGTELTVTLNLGDAARGEPGMSLPGAIESEDNGSGEQVLSGATCKGAASRQIAGESAATLAAAAVNAADMSGGQHPRHVQQQQRPLGTPGTMLQGSAGGDDSVGGGKEADARPICFRGLTRGASQHHLPAPMQDVVDMLMLPHRHGHPHHPHHPPAAFPLPPPSPMPQQPSAGLRVLPTVSASGAFPQQQQLLGGGGRSSRPSASAGAARLLAATGVAAAMGPGVVPALRGDSTSPMDASGEAEGGQWHEVSLTSFLHPQLQRRVILVVQNDVSARIWAERQLVRVVEAEHTLLENIFPHHVIEHIASTAAKAASERNSGQSGHHHHHRQRAAAVQAARLASTACAGTATISAVTANNNNNACGDAEVQEDGGAAGGGGPQAEELCQQAGPPELLPAIRGDTFLHLATSHSAITVLFCDIQGFTPMCNEVRPVVVMAFLNDLFTRLDGLLDEYGVYKVETIGDCYVAAGGLMKVDEETGAVTVRSEDVDPQHANRTVQFAKALLRAASQVPLPTTGQPVRLRVGVHSGPAMSGVVGTRMPRFCLFGDTMNTASRMESTGVPGAIHVSQATRDLAPDEPWEPTGGVEVKGKGTMNTFLLRPPLE